MQASLAGRAQRRSVLAPWSVLLGACLLWSPAAAEPIGAKWPQPDGPGSPVMLTYSYSNLLDGAFLMLTPAELRAATEEALGLWAAVAPLHFVELPDSGPAPSDMVYDPGDHPTIRIGHHEMTDRAHGFFPAAADGLAGDIHFATGAPWRFGGDTPWDYLEVITHEIGHVLGLDAEAGRPSVMNQDFANQFDGLGTAFLFPVDVEDIQGIYGAGHGSVQPLDPVPEPGTLLLVGAGGAAALLRRRRRRHPTGS